MTDKNPDVVIDLSVIEALRELGGEDDPGLVVELIDLYLLDAPERIREIQTALASADFDLLERAAHTLKSASANIGALTLSDLCKDLEKMARESDVADPDSLAERSKVAFDEVFVALTALKS